MDVNQCSANHMMPLSPINFLEQAAFVYAERVSIIYGNTTFSWRETHERCLKIASALSTLGISRGDVVAAVAPNIPALYELHFAVPMCGGVLSALNTKLDATMLASILEQLEAKVIFVDSEFVEVVHAAFETLSLAQSKPPVVILIPEFDQEVSSCVQKLPDGSLTYSSLLVMGQNDYQIVRPNNEIDPISVNYTSGSTGKPKGVIYSHRATYLNSLAAIFRFELRKYPVFLWTVDMFRCNGWCLPWAMAALGGTNICIRNVTTEVIFQAIDLHQATHLCGAPSILNKIADVPANYMWRNAYKVEVVVAGTLPPFQVLSKVQALGFNIIHGYGMTEALGPVIFNKLCKSDNMSTSSIKFQQGIFEEVDVKDSLTMKSVPVDEKTIGEVMFRSNTMMSGYHKNPEKNKKAFEGGWYRTGDLGTRLIDGCIQVKDRAIYAINYKGESISTLEIEAVLICHPMVLEAAVVAKPDNVCGETPCAFVKLKEECDENVSGEDIIKFCAEVLPCHMVPQMVLFGDLPVSSTGKIQKCVLRDKCMMMTCSV